MTTVHIMPSLLTVRFEENSVVIQLFPEKEIKFPIDKLYSTLACPYNFISTFRFNSGSMESIEGLQYLKPQFPVESSEFFDITISNQSRNIAQLERLADKHKTWGGYYSPDVSRMLMKYFPLEDQGMVLIHGPLPADKSSYPAHILKDTTTSSAPKIDANTGFGLVFKVEETHVLVQYGNGVHKLERSEISSKYDMYGTGLPTQSDEDGELIKVICPSLVQHELDGVWQAR